MNRVLDYIDRHLDQPLELDTLADVAHFSRYHFHRVFAAWVGETFGDYLRRRRMEAAAWRLAAHPEVPVLEVALWVGFGSGEAFARAFKNHFGCTPTAWRAGRAERWAREYEAVRLRRQERNLDQVDSNPDQAYADGRRHNGGSSSLPEEPPMQVDIVEFPSVKVAYMRHIGPYGPQIGQFWREAFGPWMQATGLFGEPCYGIGLDDPCLTSPDKCRYDACVEVPADFAADGRINVATLPGGRYAVTKFRGNPQTIGDTWMRMFRDWLPKSGFQCDARPCFEYYPRNWTANAMPDNFSCDICVPIRPL
jgi:AraC family transcriptional regulator